MNGSVNCLVSPIFVKPVVCNLHVHTFLLLSEKADLVQIESPASHLKFSACAYRREKHRRCFLRQLGYVICKRKGYQSGTHMHLFKCCDSSRACQDLGVPRPFAPQDAADQPVAMLFYLRLRRIFNPPTNQQGACTKTSCQLCPTESSKASRP